MPYVLTMCTRCGWWRRRCAAPAAATDEGTDVVATARTAYNDNNEMAFSHSLI